MMEIDPDEWAERLIRFDQERRHPKAREILAKKMINLSLEDHITISRAIFRAVIDGADREVRGIVGLFSGGKDSTTFMHMFRNDLTHAAHINTGIGVEQTRQFVRDVCREWDLSLIEKSPPPGDTYDELVLKYGFPGPAGHGLMYRRLKERGLRLVRKELVDNGRKQRVIFVGGMRHFESNRRMGNTQVAHRDGSIIWCSPIAWWTTDLLREYREVFDVPHNEVTDHLHMSGECLCGAYAKPGELEQIAFFYPEVAIRIRALEVRAAEAGVHCKWGTRPPKRIKGGGKAAGPLCSKCELEDDDGE